MTDHKDPFKQAGNGPVIAGLIIAVLIWLVGIATILYWIWRFLVWLF